MTPLRILFVTVGDIRNPGTRLRVFSYAPYFRARGHAVTILTPLAATIHNRWSRRILRPFELLRDVRKASRFDVVVVYRKTYPGVAATMLRRNARKLVFEYDDAVYLPSPAEPHGAAVEARYRRNFMTTVAAADLVVAGNRQLAEMAHGRPVAIVPTAVDLDVFRPRVRSVHGPREARCVFGWIGTAENLPQWERLLPAFRRLVDAVPGCEFKIVSDVAPPRYDLNVSFERFDLSREAQCLDDFDVGLMPLQDTPWNRGKCSVKALQCMARGIPVVLSPVGMNRDVVATDDGKLAGILAATEDEWVSALQRLATSPALRHEMGETARMIVEQRYSLARVATKLIETIEALAERTPRDDRSFGRTDPSG